MRSTGHWFEALMLAGLGIGCLFAGEVLPEPATGVTEGSVADAPRRVVGASVAAAEMLFDLGVPPAGVHYLAADPRYSTAADRARTANLLGGEAEDILRARPDLVVVDPFTKPETLELLSMVGVRVFRPANAACLDQALENVRALGELLGRGSEATAILADVRARRTALAANRGAVGIWRVMSLDGGLYTHGKGSLIDAVIAEAGAIDLSRERGVGPYRRLDAETVLAWRPDALLIGIEPGTEEQERARLLQHPALGVLPCVRRERLLFVPAALLGCTSHRVLGAAELIQRRLLDWGAP
ncbi:MAG: hypothetical protein Fur0037_04250 [Planctomycetota bacterium]